MCKSIPAYSFCFFWCGKAPCSQATYRLALLPWHAKAKPLRLFFLSLSAQFADRGADELYEPFPVCQVIQAEAGLCPLVRRLQHRLP